MTDPATNPAQPERGGRDDRARPGRPENRLAGDGPLQEFVFELRNLRHRRKLTVREVASRMIYSPSVVSRMASGRELPSWEHVRKFVQACDGDVAQWRKRWTQTAQALMVMPAESPHARPGSAATPQEFLVRLRARISLLPNASYRWLSRRTGYSHSTIAASLADSAARLPKWPLVAAVLRALGEDETETAAWRSAWNRIQQLHEPDEAVTVKPPQAATAAKVAPPLGLLDPQYSVRGRDKLKTELITMVQGRRPESDSGVHVLHGTGGAGKSMVALALATTASQLGQRVWWVTASDQATFVEGLTAVAAEAGATDEELRRSDPADALWRRLAATRERWLLVLDEVDDPGVLDTDHGGLLGKGTGWIRPGLPQGLVLVTSRNRRWPHWCRKHEVNELGIDDAAQVLLDYCGDRAGGIEEAEALAAALGRLPLMLRLVGSFLARTSYAPLPDPAAPTTFAGYLERFRAMRLPGAEPGEMLTVIDRVWDLSLDLLTRRGLPDAHELLRLLVTFGDAPVPFRILFTVDSLTESQLLQPSLASVSNLLEELAQVSLINLDTTDRSLLAKLDIHALVRTAGRAHRHTADRMPVYVTAAVTLIYRACTDIQPLDEPRHWPAWGLIAPHALHLLEVAPGCGVTEEVVRKAGEAAALAIRSMIARGEFYTAQRHSGAVLRTLRMVFGEQDRDTLRMLQDQATVLRKLGRYREAETIGREAWEISRGMLGEDHEDTLDLRRDLAIVHLELGRYREAEEALQHVSKLRRAQLGDGDRETLSTLHALARVQCEIGRYLQAAELFAEVFIARVQVLGPEHPETLTTLRNMARVLDDLGRFGDAEGIYVSLYEISRRVLGEEHPDTLLARFDLAKNCLLQGRFRAAEAEFHSVLEARRRILGEEHPRTLTSRRYLAMAYHALALWDDAEAEYYEVFRWRKKILGVSHPHTLSARFNLAILWRDLRNLEEARRELSAIHAEQEEWLGRDHKDTLTTHHELAVTLRDLGRLDEAEAMLGEVCRRRTVALGAEHPDTLRGRRMRAGVLVAVDRIADARAEHSRVLNLSTAVLGEEHPETLHSRSDLAQLFRCQGDNDAARREIEAVYEVRKRTLGPEHPETLTARRILARIMHASGDVDEAERAYRKVLKARVKLYGREHPDTLIVLNNLGLVHADRGRLELAETQFRTVSQAREKVLGAGHPDTLTSRHDLGNVLALQGRSVEAHVLLQQVFQARSQVLGPAHRDTALTHSLLLSSG